MNTCPNCQQRSDGIFCPGCGARIAIPYPGCGALVPPQSRFCSKCGAALQTSSQHKPKENATGITGDIGLFKGDLDASIHIGSQTNINGQVTILVDRAPRDQSPLPEPPQQQLSQKSAHALKPLEETMSNPHYIHDLGILEGRWDIHQVTTPETIYIATGACVLTELLDRPVAELLRDEIDRRGSISRGRRAVLISDIWWFQDPELHQHTIISVGGPFVNALTKQIAETGKNWKDSRLFYALVPEPPIRLAIWGQGSKDTLEAVQHYIASPDGLTDFLSLCWGIPRG